LYSVIAGLVLALAAVTASAQEAAPAPTLAGVGLAGPATGVYLEPADLPGDGQSGADYQEGNRLLDEISNQVAGDLDARIQASLEIDAPVDVAPEPRLVSNN